MQSVSSKEMFMKETKESIGDWIIFVVVIVDVELCEMW